MKSIQTPYKGYRFRSRLEARWAVFFDSIPMAWEFEPEGFVLPSGPYLPDFYLPRFKAWAEVKPVAESFDWRKAFELAAYTERPVIALIGAPEDKWLPFARPMIPYADRFGRDDIPASRDWVDIGATLGDGRFWLSGTPEYPGEKSTYDNIVRAADKARGARFEHGERP